MSQNVKLILSHFNLGDNYELKLIRPSFGPLCNDFLGISGNCSILVSVPPPVPHSAVSFGPSPHSGPKD